MYLLLGFLRFSIFFFFLQWQDICKTQLTLGQFFQKMFWRPSGRKKVSLPTVKLLFCGHKASKTFFEKTVPRLTVDCKYLAIVKKNNGKSQKP